MYLRRKQLFIMKKLILATKIFIVSAILLIACKKETSFENSKSGIEGISIDLSKKINTNVVGFVTDESGKPVSGAIASAGGVTATTDEFGYFSIEASVPEVAGVVSISKNGYFKGIRTFVPTNSAESFVRIQLMSNTKTGSFSAAAGGTVNTADNLILSFPSNAIMYDNNGAAYTGTVNVAAKWLNPSDRQTLALTMPGDLRALGENGNMQGLESFGMVAVELTSDAGEKLQIAKDKTVDITFPIPNSLIGKAPETIDFWSFDEEKGLWIYESVATKNGNTYIGKATHFSYWNCDVPYELVKFKVKIVNNKQLPLSNVSSRISVVNNDNRYGYGYTDSLGISTGYIPKNANLKFEVLSSCHDVIYSENFNTNTRDVDLGTKVIEKVENIATIKGLALDCSNKPLENGIVHFLLNGKRYRAEVKNGAFNQSIILCTASSLNLEYVVVDLDNNMQSNPVNATITTGENDLGTINTCAVASNEFINYTIDGINYSVTNADSLYTFLRTDITYINGSVTSNNSNLGFNFDGGTTVGSNHKLTYLNTNKPNQFGTDIFNPAIILNITEYGAELTGFIAGSFSGVISNPNGQSITINCSFRVRR